MDLLTYYLSIPYNKVTVEQLGMRLRAKIADLQARYIPCSLDEEKGKERYLFTCHHHKQSRKQEKILRQEIAHIVTTFYFDEWEEKWLEPILMKQLPEAFHSEVKEVKDRLQKRCRSPQKWTQILMDHLEEYLQEEKSLAIDGYIRFRFHEYSDWLEKTVKEVIDEYTLDKEYKEFIQLLRYFISMQTPKYELVHVIHQKHNQFQLLNEQGADLQLNEMDQSLQEMIELTFSHEDMIVSALLTAAPEQVVLHTKAPEENIIRTLLQIFEERITICASCTQCDCLQNTQMDQ